MYEDKRAICEALLPVLQMTWNLHDLERLEYTGIGQTGEEFVIGYFRSGYHKTANVTADSGTSMIRDIVKQLV